jgi:acetyl-CoA carboxylase biotin carboxyl carrier protein
MNEEARRNVEAVVRLFREHKLIELKVEHDGFSLHLRREVVVSKPAAAAEPVQKKAPAPARPGKQGRTVAVRSPLIGVFYRAATPEADPFVEIGDMVTEGQSVCIVEAMKVFNEIKAEWSGRVVAIPAENGALVQAGDPLIVLEFPQPGQQGSST